MSNSIAHFNPVTGSRLVQAAVDFVKELKSTAHDLDLTLDVVISSYKGAVSTLAWALAIEMSVAEQGGQKRELSRSLRDIVAPFLDQYYEGNEAIITCYVLSQSDPTALESLVIDVLQLARTVRGSVMGAYSKTAVETKVKVEVRLRPCPFFATQLHLSRNVKIATINPSHLIFDALNHLKGRRPHFGHLKAGTESTNLALFSKIIGIFQAHGVDLPGPLAREQILRELHYESYTSDQHKTMQLMLEKMGTDKTNDLEIRETCEVFERLLYSVPVPSHFEHVAPRPPYPSFPSPSPFVVTLRGRQPSAA